MYTLPAEPPHTVSGPFMVQVGDCWTLRLEVSTLVQPLASVMVSRTVKEPLLFGVIVTEDPVALPFMVPLELTPHLWALMPGGPVNTYGNVVQSVSLLGPGLGVGPVITPDGKGLMVTGWEHEAVQPLASVMVTLTV